MVYRATLVANTACRVLAKSPATKEGNVLFNEPIARGKSRVPCASSLTRLPLADGVAIFIRHPAPVSAFFQFFSAPYLKLI